MKMVKTSAIVLVVMNGGQPTQNSFSGLALKRELGSPNSITGAKPVILNGEENGRG